MAGITRNWTTPLAFAVLLFGVGIAVRAQNAHSGSLSGKLTDLHSAPLANTTVLLRNQATGAEARTTTSQDGGYRFDALDEGEYTLEAESPRLGRGMLRGIMISAGHLAKVQAAVQFEFSAPVTARAVFVRNSGAPPPGTLILEPVLTGSAPAPRPLAVATAEPPVTETPVLTAMLYPVTLAKATIGPLPTGELAHLVAVHPVTRAATVFEGMAQCVAAAHGVVKAMQVSMPHAYPVEVATRDAELGSSYETSTLSSTQIQSLPIRGRLWEEFVADSSPPAGSSVTPQPSSGGAGRQTASALVDGEPMQLAFGDGSSSSFGSRGQSTSADEGGEPQGMGHAWSAGRNSVSEAAVRSVRTFAGNAGVYAGLGRMEVETQSGTNALHGQAFLFDRQNIWGARNPFTQWTRETAPATAGTVPQFTAQPFTPPDHEVTWGIGAAGRIRPGKLFWFGALDAMARNDPALSSVKWPGNFFAQPAIDQMQLLGAQLGTSTSTALANYSRMLETLDGLLGPTERTARKWSGFARVDWQAAERFRFSFEGEHGYWNTPGGGLSRVTEFYGNHSLGSSHATEQRFMARWQAYVTPNLMTVTQVSISRNLLNAHAQSPSDYEQTLNKNVWGQLPQIVVDSRYGLTIGNPSRFGQGSYPDERAYHVQESVNWVRGSLLVNAGLDLSHNADATGLLRNRTGTYHYANVENFVADALVFAADGFSDALDKFHQHNCDPTGKAWRDAAGQLRGLGYLPCYSHYTQMMGPTNWNLSTNDWAGYTSGQWQPNRFTALSIGLRAQHQQLPPPIAALANPDLPLTAKLTDGSFNWAPRLSLAIGQRETHWPVLRLGYGMYYGRISNATLLTALTQTGSPKGDLSFFVRPTDNLNAGGAPPFPYVFAGEPLNVVKPGAVEFAPNFHDPEIHQAAATVEEKLPGRTEISASAVVSLGRRLPISIDSNFDPAVNPGTITYAVVDGTGKGPIKAKQITVPFYASWPSANLSAGAAGRLNSNYQQIAEIFSRANSTYEALILKVNHYGRRGLSFQTHYTYGHAMDWNPNESSSVSGNDVLDPRDFSREYGTSNLDVRHSAGITLVYTAPWKLHSLAGELVNGWMLSGIGHYRSGLPYTMHTGGSLAKEFNSLNGSVTAALGPGMNGSGGDNRVYGVGNDKVAYDIGRNTFRYPATWKADLRVSRQFDLGALRQLRFMAESYNLFNHQNLTELETMGYSISPGTLTGGLPTLNFLTGLKANTAAFGQPLTVDGTNYYRERQIQFGLQMTF